MRIILVLIYLLFFSPPLHAIKGLSESGEILDLSDICITVQKGERPRSPGGWKRPGRPVDEIIDEYIEPHRDQLSKVKVIDLSSNNLTGEVLNFFVLSLQNKSLWDLFKNVQLVCLENNSFSAEVAPTLAKFLSLYGEEGEDKTFPYISIVNTPVSLSNVNKLARKLKEISPPHLPPLMAHLIFMKKYYVWHAEKKIQTYHTMVKSQDLPLKWNSIQRGYYKSTPYQRLASYRNQQRDKDWVTFVSHSLSQYSPSGQEASSSTGVVKPIETSEIEALAKIVGAFSFAPRKEADSD
ncbi:MAG: hypothetical protein K2X02_02655 [Alphaproteobacteria bacterium]|nr:hypothetical protein [Alphaproteobacteria bacterium]